MTIEEIVAEMKLHARASLIDITPKEFEALAVAIERGIDDEKEKCAHIVESYVHEGSGNLEAAVCISAAKEIRARKAKR